MLSPSASGGPVVEGPIAPTSRGPRARELAIGGRIRAPARGGWWWGGGRHRAKNMLDRTYLFGGDAMGAGLDKEHKELISSVYHVWHLGCALNIGETQLGEAMH